MTTSPETGEAQNSQRDYRICILTFPSKTDVYANSKLVEALLPISKEILVVGGDLSGAGHARVHVKRLHHWRSGGSTLYKVMALAVSQLDACVNLARAAGSFETLILYDIAQLEILPALLAKALRKKVVMYQAGSFQLYFEILSKGKVLALERILALVAEVIARVTHQVCDAIVVDTERVIEPFGLGRFRNKVQVCPYSYIDTSIFRVTTDFQDRGNLVGFIGRVSQEKGVIEFVKAIPLVLSERPDVEFLIAGDGPLLDWVKRELSSSQLENKVRIPGRIPIEDVSWWLNRLKLLVVPSYIEGIPKTLLEAVVCGTPVLAVAQGGILDVVRDGNTGFILKNNSPECIAESIAQCLKHPNLKAVAENARAIVEREYGYETVVKKWAQIIARVNGKT